MLMSMAQGVNDPMVESRQDQTERHQQLLDAAKLKSVQDKFKDCTADKLLHLCAANDNLDVAPIYAELAA